MTKTEVTTLGEWPTEDVFRENDDGSLDMKIPDEIAAKLGLEKGDTVKLELGDQGTIIISKAEKDEG